MKQVKNVYKITADTPLKYAKDVSFLEGICGLDYKSEAWEMEIWKHNLFKGVAVVLFLGYSGV
jgi:hypothetical protein